MANFPLNLKHFKKTASNDNFTTLKHKSGHEIRLAHKALNPEHQELIKAMSYGDKQDVPVPQKKEIDSRDWGGAPSDKSSSLHPSQNFDHGGEINKGYDNQPSSNEGRDQPSRHAQEKGVHKSLSDSGNSTAGSLIRHGAKHPGGGSKEAGIEKHKKVLSEIQSMPKPNLMAHGGNPKLEQSKLQLNNYADGDEVSSDDFSDRMKKLSDIGEYQQVANNAYNTKSTADPALDRYIVSKSPSSIKDDTPPAQDDRERQDDANAAAFKKMGGARALNEGNDDADTSSSGSNSRSPSTVVQNVTSDNGQSDQYSADKSDVTPTGDSSQTVPPAPALQPNDLGGVNTEAGAYEQGMAEQHIGQQQLANAAKAEGLMKEASIKGTMQADQNVQDQYQQHISDLTDERQGFIDDYMNARIDPNKYLNDMSTGGRISTAIGLMLGGMGGGLMKQGNPALDFLNKQIDRDIKGQEMDLGRKHNLLSANLAQFGNLRDATNMSHIMMNDMVKHEILQAGAKYQGAYAQAAANNAIGLIDKDSSDRMGDIASRKTALSGSGGTPTQSAAWSKISPDDKVANAWKVAKYPDANTAMNDLQDAKERAAKFSNVMDTFDKIAGQQKLWNRAWNPIQSKSLIDSFNKTIGGMAKQEFGKFTAQDAHFTQQGFAKLFDTPGTVAQKRQEMIRFMTPALINTHLQRLGITPEQLMMPQQQSFNLRQPKI